MKVEFTFHVVGGPMDGKSFAFTGEMTSPSKPINTTEWSHVNIDGHKYAVVDVDNTNNSATLMW